MYFAEFCDIIEDGLLYIFQSGGLLGGKSASLGHISGWDRVSSTGMSRWEVSYCKKKRGKIMPNYRQNKPEADILMNSMSTESTWTIYVSPDQDRILPIRITIATV